MGINKSLTKLSSSQCADTFYSSTTEDVTQLFQAAYKSGLKAIHTISQDKNSEESETFIEIHAELSLAYNELLKRFNNELKAISVDECLTTESSDLGVDAKAAVNFHADALSLVTNSELAYQIKLEQCFQQARINFHKLHETATTGTTYDEHGNRFLSDLGAVSPGILALSIQQVFDGKFDEIKTTRIAFRFIACDFFSTLTNNYIEWLPDVRRVSSKLNLNRETTYTEVDPETGQVLSDEISSTQAPSSSGAPTVEVTEELKKLLQVASDGTLQMPQQVSNALSQHFGGSFTEVDLASMNADTQVNSLDISELQNVLQGMQSAPMDLGGDVRSVLKNALTNLSGDNIIAVIDQVSENIINLVAYLFEGITSNDNLISEVKFEIQKVQVPIMRMALSDSSIFQSGDHPARSYLDNLGHLGLKISGTDEDGYQFLTQSISNLLDQSNHSNETYEVLNSELEKFFNNSDYKAHEIIDHDEQTQGRESEFEQVDIFLDDQASKLSCELMFHKFLRLLWYAVLSRIVAEKKFGSAEWTKATSIYTSLLWTTQLESTDTGKREVLRNIPKVVLSVKELFAVYGINDTVKEAIFDYMFKIHLAIIRGEGFDSIEDDFGASLTIFSASNLISSKNSRSSEGKKAPSKATSMDTGKDIAAGIDFGDVDDSVSNITDDNGNTTIVAASHEAPDVSSIDSDSSEEPLDFSLEFSLPDDTDPIVAASSPSLEASDAVIVEDDDTVVAHPTSAAMDEAFEAAGKLKAGEMFQIIINGVQKRYELVHASRILGKYTFQEFSARNIIEITKAELVLEIVAGNIAAIENASLFDTALESIVTNLRLPAGSEKSTSLPPPNNQVSSDSEIEMTALPADYPDQSDDRGSNGQGMSIEPIKRVR